MFHPTGKEGIQELTELPEIATKKKAKLLMGVEKYDFSDGKSNGPEEPKWR